MSVAWKKTKSVSIFAVHCGAKPYSSPMPQNIPGNVAVPEAANAPAGAEPEFANL
jgi:hypothetical protein